MEYCSSTLKIDTALGCLTYRIIIWLLDLKNRAFEFLGFLDKFLGFSTVCFVVKNYSKVSNYYHQASKWPENAKFSTFTFWHEMI